MIDFFKNKYFIPIGTIIIFYYYQTYLLFYY